jgi:hypothetical protein
MAELNNAEEGIGLHQLSRCNVTWQGEISDDVSVALGDNTCSISKSFLLRANAD